MMKRLAFLVLALVCFAGCSSKDKIVVPTNAPTTTIEPVEIGGKGGAGGAVGGLNKKIPGK